MPTQNSPKRQHYLPAVYLKQFSPDAQNATRKSSLWRLGATGQAFVKVEDQCREAFHYSKSRSRQAEDLFQEGETLYGDALAQVWQGSRATRRQYYGLIIMMMSLHLRNPAYKNFTPLNNLDLYLGLERTFMAQVLMADVPGERSQDEMWNYLSEVWQVTIMKTPGELFTSDNPSLFCAMDDSRDLHFILLPVTPKYCAVAFDKRYLEITGPMMAEDLLAIYNLLVGASNQALFSHRQFTSEESEVLSNMRKVKEPLGGHIDGTYWTPNFLILRNPFTFFRYKPDG